jgi:tRNA threonylcarbamoyladenosine biosynthesis protein TsaB
VTAGEPIVLALETATKACSVAVLGPSGGAWRTALVDRRHAETLMPMILATLAEANLRFADLDVLAVGVGPGAFTSLRVGLAAAHGLALATGLPCLGVTSFDAVALRLREPGRARLAALDSRRAELFVQAFDEHAPDPLTPPLVLPAERLAGHLPPRSWIVGGDAAAAVADALTAAGIDARVADDAASPDADAVAILARRRWCSGERPAGPPQPLYLRPPDTGRLR